MVATTWNKQTAWPTSYDATSHQAHRTRYADGEGRRHELEVVEDEGRTYVISHQGLLQHRGFGDFVHYLSRGLLIYPLIFAAVATPVAVPLLSMGEYMLLALCFSHLIIVATVLTVWAIAVNYIDVQRGEEAVEARPMTAADGDPSMGARSPQVKPKHAA